MTKSIRRSMISGVVAMIAAAGLIGASASAVAAANYTVVQCFWAQHAIAQGSGIWGSGGVNPGRVASDNNCQTGGGLGTYTTGSAGTRTFGKWAWTAPAGAYIAHTQVQHKSREGNGWQAYYLFDVVGGGNGVRNLGTVTEFTYRQFSVNARGFAAYLQCKLANCGSGPQHMYVRRIWFTMVDEGPPTIDGLAGPLLAGGTRHGRENLTIQVSDRGSGVRAVTVQVNGDLIHHRDLLALNACSRSPASQSIATRLRPCPESDSVTMPIQTDDGEGPWREGANTLRVCVRDFSGQSACRTRTVVVDNSCPSSGAEPASRLNGGVQQAGGLRSLATLRSNQDVVVGGSLHSSAGAPVNDAIVCVYQTDAVANATPQLVRTLRTKNGGRFGAVLDRGPSRRLRFVYRYNNTVLEDAAQVRARVFPVLRVGRTKVRNGTTLRFWGRLPGPRNAGRVVSIQVRFPKKWRTFKAPRTNARGRFRAAYHFVNSSTFRYTFRAMVKRQRGYPYEPGSSRKRRVLVRGR